MGYPATYLGEARPSVMEMMHGKKKPGALADDNDALAQLSNDVKKPPAVAKIPAQVGATFETERVRASSNSRIAQAGAGLLASSASTPAI